MVKRPKLPHAQSWIFLIATVIAIPMIGCGSATTTSTNTADSGAVLVTVMSPTSGSVMAASTVTVRGTVSPSDAVVQIQGHAAAVGNGVFTGSAALHTGKTTIDIIGSAPNKTPDATSVTLTRQSTHAGHTTTTTVVQTVATPPSPPVKSPTGGQSFFAPSGNVSCSIQQESARCSVASVDLTFVIPSGGGSAYISSGLSVPRGSGTEAPFGTERSYGSITCQIPPENVPAGITCQDTTTRHGFEASRVPSRQNVH